MPYVGKTPLVGAYQLCDAITTSATATYNLTVGGSAVVPGSAQNCIVSLNGVIQAPVNAYTVSGSQITFSSALTSSDVIDFIVILGNVFDIGKPTDGSVTNASVSASAAIALSKLATTGTMTFASTIGVGGATPAASGAGVSFPATASASSDANTLDDYEEGTFTPAFSSTGATFAYSVQQGVYTKIGRQVCFSIYLQLDGAQTLTANAVTITGLPFTSANIGSLNVDIVCSIRYVNLSAGASTLVARVGQSSTSLSLIENGDNYASTVLNSNALSGSSGQVFVSGTYPAS